MTARAEPLPYGQPARLNDFACNFHKFTFFERETRSMLNRTNIPTARVLVWGTVACVIAAVLAVPVGLGVAYADTALGIRIIDTTQTPVAGEGATALGIRITASANTITFDKKEGSGGSGSVQATLGSPLPNIEIPTRSGYTFLGYFDDDKKQYYKAAPEGSNVATSAVEKWDKASDTTLIAHWALQINCSFPSEALIQIDATGKASTSNLTFSSTTVEDIKITAVKGTRDAGVSSIFVDDATINGTRILLTPPAGLKVVEMPLTEIETSVPADWTIGAKLDLSVAFSLSLPDNARLNYLANDGKASIANLTYEVSAAKAPA